MKLDVWILAGVLCVCALAFAVGYRVGYNEGFVDVESWYEEEYLPKYCIEPEKPTTYRMEPPEFLFNIS